MSEQPNAYAAVIADLKRKRNQIDQAIKALEELSGGTGPADLAEPSAFATSAPAMREVGHASLARVDQQPGDCVLADTRQARHGPDGLPLA